MQPAPESGQPVQRRKAENSTILTYDEANGNGWFWLLMA
jgi:hypothetical protein